MRPAAAAEAAGLRPAGGVRPSRAPACRHRRIRVPRPPARRARCGWPPRRGARTSSQKKCAVASPSTVGLVARMTSRTLPALEQSPRTARRPELIGTDAIERREVAHQHEVASAIAARLLDRHHIGRGFDHAHLARHRAAASRRSNTAPPRSACGSAGSGAPDPAPASARRPVPAAAGRASCSR